METTFPSLIFVLAALVLPNVLPEAIMQAIVYRVFGDKLLTLVQLALVLVGLYVLLRPADVGELQLKEDIKETNFKTVDVEKIMNQQTPATGQKYLIVGAGFFGKKLIHALLLRGETNICAFDIDPNACKQFGERVEFFQGDVTKLEQVEAAAKGVDTVFCTFAIIRYMDYLPHEANLSYRINVLGTKTVVEACQKVGVKTFIQTSTSNVAVGRNACFGMDEKNPYVTRRTSPNHYGWTKAEAESLVLESDGVMGMRTAAIRPCSGIFGAEDNYMLDAVIKTGRMILPPTGGVTKIDFVYVENCVHGHLLLEAAMQNEEKKETVCGETFCVSNNDPMRMYDFVGTLSALRPGGVQLIAPPKVLLCILAYVVDSVNRFVPTAIKPNLGKDLGSLTPATLEYLDLSYSFKSTKAEQLLGYKPIYTVEQGVQKSVFESIEQRMLPPLRIVN
mmetsp:Transcript_11689/g.19025  ORF Transcript_11689/g.19025 Transcript_11689/m.19025 type:complete len:448 (+) Transcript_11689:1195-2538(+)|eukprot:CAMPEP_0203758036 /NCGR_PEP_ID=MMETSP0098-20131031/10819_1 /ASSEMBLY_ACC=CAM_ASM_000208 /TAXON_ID=96639 /ORGANISM=" , Strain NY0313808BC1" /LENGTH=447 /DNA_ID=CAMNT_0050650283 /DNA_START=67 /DNA_END=1410 /DNA_ORIENTATION=+